MAEPSPVEPKSSLMGSQLKELASALMSAFPSRNSLEIMLRFELDQKLEHITLADNLPEVVFELIEWAQAQGRLVDLIEGSRKDNPGNEMLRSFAEQFSARPKVSQPRSQQANLNLLLRALAVVAKDDTNQATKDAYNGLESLIRRKLACNQDAETALVRYENAPEQWEEPLKEVLLQSEATNDQEIMDKARKVIELDSTQQAIGKFNVHVAGSVQGLVQGDNAQVNMTFNEKPPDDHT